MQEPALPVLLPSHLDASRHNRALEARAVQTFPEHFVGAPDVRIPQKAGSEQAEVDGRDFVGPGVGVGQGMELRNRALPIGASANGTDRAASSDGPRRRT